MIQATAHDFLYLCHTDAREPGGYCLDFFLVLIHGQVGFGTLLAVHSAVQNVPAAVLPVLNNKAHQINLVLHAARWAMREYVGVGNGDFLPE